MSNPRQTKIGTVTTMLEAPKGTNLKAICKATGWQPHSARAALSGLRKAGHVIDRTEPDGKSGGSTYRIIKATGAAK